QVSGDPERAVLVDRRQPTAAGVEVAAPPGAPRMSRSYELGRSDRERVAGKADLLAPGGVELRVNHLPLFAGRVPVLGHPVVLEPSRAEIRTESAASARRHTCCSKKRHREPAERMAAAPNPIGHRS